MEITKTKKNIHKAIKETKWKARLERKKYKNKIFYIDISHNIEGIKETITFLKKKYSKPINVAFGFLKDKDFKDMIKFISKNTNKVFIFPTKKFNKERGTTQKDFKMKIKKYKNINSVNSIPEALKRLRKENGLSLLTGSIYNYEHIINKLKEKT